MIDARRDTAAIIGDGDRVVVINDNGNIAAIAGQGLIDGIIDDFVDQMMQPLFARGANVHTRPALDRFQTFQSLKLVGAVFMIGFCCF